MGAAMKGTGGGRGGERGGMRAWRNAGVELGGVSQWLRGGEWGGALNK